MTADPREGSGVPVRTSAEEQLNDQIKRLIRSERAHYLSQQALQLQLRRMSLLNGFALASNELDGPEEILRHGLELLLELFPLEQGVAMLCVGKQLRCVATCFADPNQSRDPGTVPSFELSGNLVHALAGAHLLCPSSPRLPPAEDRALRQLIAEVFDRSRDCAAGDPILVLPLWERPTAPVGALLCRRVSRLTPVERPLPTPEDTDLLEVLGRQIAVAVSNARLVRDLRRSYDQLATTQEELVRQERLAAVGELAAQIAHEVRNPVGAILNAVSRLRKVSPPEGEAEALVEIVGEESERLAQMIDDLLGFAHPRAPNRRPESLEAILESALEGVTRSGQLQGITLRFSPTPGLPPVQVDAQMIRQAVLNLILNAAQAMGGSGTLTLRTRMEQDGTGSWACIDVSDTGPGIPPEVAGRLFQPFFTTKATGTGLGLALVRRLIEGHQGRATFTSTPGSGTTFTLHLPAESAQQELTASGQS